MLVISDTSPIRALDGIGCLKILGELFVSVMIPPAVAYELQRNDGPYPPIQLTGSAFIRIVAPADQSRVDKLNETLDAGESEAIALAQEYSESLLLIDEKSGRQTARQLNLPTVGTVGVLILAKERKLIPSLAPLLTQLVNDLNFFLSDELIKTILSRVGEANNTNLK